MTKTRALTINRIVSTLFDGICVIRIWSFLWWNSM